MSLIGRLVAIEEVPPGLGQVDDRLGKTLAEPGRLVRIRAEQLGPKSFEQIQVLAGLVPESSGFIEHD